MKKFISLLLSIAMLLSLTAGLNLSAYADISGNFEYEWLDPGTVLLKKYTGSAENLVLPDKLNNREIVIDSDAFENCINLKSITISKGVVSINTGENAFEDCINLENIYVNKDNEYYYSDDGVLFSNSNDGVVLEAYPAGNKRTEYFIPDNVIAIENKAFANCKFLKSVIISENVNRIDVAFYYCKSLQKVQLPNTIKDIGNWTFVGCENLKKINIPKSVEHIGEYAFCQCYSLENIVLPENVSFIGEDAFYRCSQKTITVLNKNCIINNQEFDSETVLRGYTGSTAQQYALENDIKFGDIDSGFEYQKEDDNTLTVIGYFGIEKDIIIPKHFSGFDIKNICFKRNYGEINRLSIDVQSIVIQNNIEFIDDCAFADCSAVKKIELPDSITRIGEQAFWECKSLTEIVIPDSVTSIGAWAFFNCEGLTTISIPASVTEIDYGIFQQCNNLKTIIVDKNNKVYDSRDNCNAIVKTASNEIIEACANTTFPQSVKAIGDGAFGWRKVPESIVIPEHITKIDAQAFAGSTLKDITILNGSCDINNFIYPPNTGGAQQYTFDDEVVINGYKNSTAQVYADTHGNKFVALSNHPIQEKFADLNGYDYYNEFVAYTSVYNEFLKGTNPPANNVFEPARAIDRAMMVTILYRMAGEPYANGGNPYTSSPFTDITNTSVYYYDAACWALKNGITTETTFKPFDNVSREQTASFLFRYAKDNDELGDDAYKNVNLAAYPDYSSVHGWAVEAMQWANYNGMITGTQQGYINPQGATQRIHATKILYGFGKVCNIGNFS